MTDVSLQRLNMVESQVRPSDVIVRRFIRGRACVGMTGDVRGRMARTAITMLPLLGLALYAIFLSCSER